LFFSFFEFFFESTGPPHSAHRTVSVAGDLVPRFRQTADAFGARSRLVSLHCAEVRQRVEVATRRLLQQVETAAKHTLEQVSFNSAQCLIMSA
jgi:hypothetical protein